MFRTTQTIELEVRTHEAKLLEQAQVQRCIADLPKNPRRQTWRFWRTYSLRPAAA